MKRSMTRLLIAVLLLLTVFTVLTACDRSGEFTVTIKDGETTLKTLTFEKDAPITIDLDDNDFLKPGYEVEALYTDAALTAKFEGDITATADLTLYVKYEPRPFKIIVIDDPNSTTYRSVEVTYGGTYTITEPTRAGFLFLGYTHVKDGTPAAFPLSGTYTQTNTISISAQWKKLASITVYDELTDEQVGSVIYADKDGKFTLPAVSTEKNGYTFGGYAIPGVTLTKQADGSYTGTVATDGDLQATLKWNAIPSYRLDVQGLYGSDIIPSASYKTGETFTLPAAPTREGYFFMGYTVNGQPLTLTDGKATFTWSEATTVTATWKKQATITVYNGTTLVETIKVPQNGAYTLNTPADTETHTFGGFTSKGVAFAASGTYLGEEDLTVMQVWNLIPTYLLAVNGLYGTDAIPAASYKTGDTFTLPTAPTREGYYFMGYTVNGQPLALTDGKATFTWSEATTITANWRERIYITVIDELTKAVLGKIEVLDGAYDLSAMVPAEEDRVVQDNDTTYTYLGFTYNGEAFAVSDTDYTGSSVTVTRDWNGVDRVYLHVISKGALYSFATVEIEDGRYAPLTTPSLTGFHFIGYYTDEACTEAFDNSGEYDGSADLTVYAKWKKQATITVYNGTEIVETIVVPQNGVYTLNTPADTETHTFGGFTSKGIAFAASGTYLGEEDLTVMQVWNLIPTYLLTVNGLYGADVIPAASYKTGATFTLPAAPTREGYFFMGYTVNGQPLTLTDGKATFTWSEATTITATWKKQIVITIYDDLTNLPVGSVLADLNGAFTLPAVTETKEGYLFTDYVIPGIVLTKQADGSYTGVATGETDLSATQKWTAIPSFNWSVDANGGAFAAGTVTSGTAYESTAVALPIPERDGYDFLGYFYGDGIMLAKNGDAYILPTFADAQVKNLKLTAKWEISKNATGEQKDPVTGDSLHYFREELNGELVYVFLTGQTYYFGTDPLTFGGTHATCITPVNEGGKYGFKAVAPGSFTMTQNGVTVICRVEYSVISSGVGSNTTGRLEANFKGGIDGVLDAGHKNFLPDIVGGTVSFDKIPYTVTVKEGDTAIVNTAEKTYYTILPNGKIDFSDDLVGKTLTVTYTPTYALAEDKATGRVSTSVTVLLNAGVNVYTNDELYTAYADLSVRTINILRNITAALQPQHYTVNEYGLLVHNDDYRNGVYLRLPNGGDELTLNGNCYTIDASKIPAVNPDLEPGQDDKATWADGYTGVNASDIWMVNVQVGVFVYYEQKGNNATAPGGTLKMNDLYITGNEYEITKSVQDSNAKTYWEKTYPINEDSSKRVVASSGAIHGLILRSTNAVVENVKIDHTQTAFFNDGYSHAPVVNDLGTPGNPTALLVHLQLNNVIADQNFNTSFFGWGQVGLTMTNSFFGKSAGPAIVFSDTPITGAAMMNGCGSFANLGEGAVVENFVTGAEAWFRSYMATSAAGDVKSLLGQQLYPQIKPLIGVELTPTREYGNDKIEAFNAIMVTNIADEEDSFAEDAVGMPFTPAYIGGTEMSTDISQTGKAPLPQTIGGKIYQHIPSNGASPSMQIILEVFVKPAEESESAES